MDKLDALFAKQRQLQVEKMGGDPCNLDGPLPASTQKRIQFIKDMVMALEDELHEALAEVGWKPWATSTHINRDAYVGEMVDALHFFLNLCLVVGVDADELFTKYLAKNAKNAQRQDEGYDGVSTKCPGCNRALDDDAVQCMRYTATTEENLTKFWCVVHRMVVFSPPNSPLSPSTV